MSPEPTAASIFNFLDESIRANAGFLLRNSDVETGAGYVQFGMGDDLLPVIVVPLSDGEPDREDSKAKGFLVKTAPIPEDPAGGRGLMLKCLDLRLRAPFAYLADDVCASIAGSPDRSPGLVCMEVLDRWRSLFQLRGPDVLSESAQIGLIAELHVLEQALEANNASLETWLGPDKGRNDFLAPTASVEVKATLGRDTFVVGIHGIRQLEVPSDGNPLWLYAEQMEPYPDSESVATAVLRVLNIVSDRVAFLKKLDTVGLRLEEIDAYKTSYRVVRRRLIPVTNKFPRITQATLTYLDFADHFTRVEYSVDIGALPSTVTDDDALAHVGGLFK